MAFESIALCKKEIVTEQDVKSATEIDAFLIAQFFFSNEIELVQYWPITINLVVGAIKVGTGG